MKLDRDSPIPVYLQLEQRLEEAIRRGDLGAHHLLASVPEMAGQAGVSAMTVQKAYRRLQERGLTYSIPGKGTFVAEPKEAGFVAILVHHETLTQAAERPTYPLLIQTLRQELLNRRIEVRVLVDWNPRQTAMTAMPSELLAVVRDQPVQALITVGHYGSPEFWRQVRERQIPTMGMGVGQEEIGEHLDIHLKHDFIMGVELALDHFQRQACDRVALIWIDRLEGKQQTKQWRLRQIEAAFLERGLPFRPHWILGVGRDLAWSGYHALEHLWAGTGDRPRGLVVTDDVVGRGVALGLRDQGIRVPEDLEIVTLHNQGSPLVPPATWHRYVMDLPEWASTIGLLVNEMIEGRRVPVQLIRSMRWEAAKCDPADALREDTERLPQAQWFEQADAVLS